MKRISIFLITVALTAGMIGFGCGGGEYDLTIASTAGGSITTPGEGTFTYAEGTVVNLVAEAEEGYRFVKWTWDVETIADTSDATTTITMNDDYSIGARFALEIRDWNDLNDIRNNLSGIYLLMNDLDSTTAGYEELASPTANEGKGWQPIGNGTSHAPFTGIFYGQGYEIRYLFINRPDEEDAGLFGFLSAVGLIMNVGVVNADVTGDQDVGGLVGSNSGNVHKSYSTGSVTGNSTIGGLVGLNNGVVENSYSTGSVTGNSIIGGLVGLNLGYAINSYSTGSVTGNSTIGGLVGWNWDGTASNSFWDTQTSGQATSDCGTGKTTAEMKDVATFSGAGWNIIAVANPGTRDAAYTWNIVDGETYPFLNWQSVS